MCKFSVWMVASVPRVPKENWWIYFRQKYGGWQQQHRRGEEMPFFSGIVLFITFRLGFEHPPPSSHLSLRVSVLFWLSSAITCCFMATIFFTFSSIWMVGWSATCQRVRIPSETAECSCLTHFLFTRLWLSVA